MRETVGTERIRQLWVGSRRVVKGTGSRHRITTATPTSSREINRALVASSSDIYSCIWVAAEEQHYLITSRGRSSSSESIGKRLAFI
jgi:hypothetical protein